MLSEAWGVARFFHKGHTVTLYKSGRVDVHRVESEDEAVRLIDDKKPLIKEAFVDSQPLSL